VDALEARFSLGFALVTSSIADCQEALPLFLSSAEVAEGLGDMTNLARALAYATIASRRLDKLAETVALAERLQRTAEEAQLLPYLGVACACLAWASWRKSERHGDEASQNARRRLDEARAWWSRAGHPFPFRWLAELVALGLAVDADNPLEAAEPLAVLGRADQFQLPESLDQAIAAARAACAAQDVEVAQRALQVALGEARKAGF